MVFRRKPHDEKQSVSEASAGGGDEEAKKAELATETAVRAQVSTHPNVDQAKAPRDDDITNDLIRRVMAAIDDWARANRMNSLPKHIIFEQALSILNAIDRNLPSGE